MNRWSLRLTTTYNAETAEYARQDISLSDAIRCSLSPRALRPLRFPSSRAKRPSFHDPKKTFFSARSAVSALIVVLERSDHRFTPFEKRSSLRFLRVLRSPFVSSEATIGS